MDTSLATALYVVGILYLFYLNREDVPTSGALWLPVLWFLILGSRAVSVWMGVGSGVYTTPDQLLEGSPTDALVFGLLLLGGLVVLVRRRIRVASLIKRNGPLVVYFVYCLISVGWSDFPDISLKRWVKAIGDLVIALVVVTDAQPVMAIRRLLSRLGFVLMPLSILFIKYYPYLGRYHEAWTGEMFNGGVTTNKNHLGVTTYILTIGALWQVLRLWRTTHSPIRSRQLLAQCSLVVCGIWLLVSANSATAIASFAFGCVLILFAGLRRFEGRPSGVHTFVFTILVFGALMMVTNADSIVIRTLGRNPDLTGRASDIWPLLLPMVPNSLFGAGFESFWLGPRLLRVWSAFPNLYVNEAHNGYIEVYLNLGLIGVALVLMMLIQGYRRSVAGFQVDPSLASLMLSFIMSIAIYNYTEAGFRSLSFPWGFLVLAILGGSWMSASRLRTSSRPHALPNVSIVQTGSPSRASWESQPTPRRLNTASVSGIETRGSAG